MNCKPGDLAVYIGRVQSLKGWVFRVVAPGFFPLDPLTPAWVTDPPPPPSQEYLAIGMVYDQSLMPLRNPGDDAKDESLSWKPVPRKELIPLKVRGEVRAE